MTLSICSRTLRHDHAKRKFALEGRIQRRKTVTSSCCSHSPCTSWIARAILTVVVDHLLALPAELGPALSAFHVTTSSVLLNVLRAVRAPLGLFLNGGQALVLFLEPIFDAELVLGAGFVLVPRAIARDARFGAAVLAGADIWCARA
jgi:hypothetical protein